MITYKNPKSLDDLKAGDIYQIKYPLWDKWTDQQTFYNNECRSRKETLIHLIDQNRVRIVEVI